LGEEQFGEGNGQRVHRADDKAFEDGFHFISLFFSMSLLKQLLLWLRSGIAVQKTLQNPAL